MKKHKSQTKATIQQEQALKRCSGCLWVRNIDRTRGKVSCSLPSCVRRWDKNIPSDASTLCGCSNRKYSMARRKNGRDKPAGQKSGTFHPLST